MSSTDTPTGRGVSVHRVSVHGAPAAARATGIVVQLVVLRRYFFLQPVLLGVGLVVAGLARRTHPGERLLPQSTKDNPGPR